MYSKSMDWFQHDSDLRHERVKKMALKWYRRSNENYRSVPILPVKSKIFEKMLCKQIILFMTSF